MEQLSRRDFLILWLSGIVGAAAVLPYAFTIQHDIIAQAEQSLLVLVFASLVQTAVLLAIAVYFGLQLSRKLQLAVFTDRDQMRHIAYLAIPLGIVTAFLIMFGDTLFARHLPTLSIADTHIEPWKTLLASLYGGIVEEILMRLFLMSLIAWLIALVFRARQPRENSWIMWTAIIATAILFGLGHLPVTASLVTITPFVVARAIALNGIGGLVFGWLYWKKGLLYAMLAHSTTDIVLLTILPLLIQ